MRKIKNEIKFPQKNPLETSVVIFIVLSLISCMGLLLFYFNSPAHATCYPSPPLPVPNLVYTGSEDYQVDGNWFTRYKLEVTNRAEFPDELFETAPPELQPCGLNYQSSRTWVDIYDNNNNNYIYGFCALSSSDNLKSLWFAVPKGTPHPYSVYITMLDRLCNITYTSTPSIILGDDFSGEMIDRTKWADLEFVRFVGIPMYRARGPVGSKVLESWLRRYGSNGYNYLVFKDSNIVKSFKADVTVNYYEYHGGFPHALAYGAVYNADYDDLTPGNGQTGDVLGVVGIYSSGSDLEGYYRVVKCTGPNCNLPNETQTICEGFFGAAELGTTYPLSFSWNDSTSTFTFGFGGMSIDVNSNPSNPYYCPLPTHLGSPKVQTKGIGTRISSITTGSGEGGFIAATFDNVYADQGSGLVLYDDFETSNIDPGNWRTWEFIRAVSDGELVSALTQRGVNGSNNTSFVNSQAILGFKADLKVLEFQYDPVLPVRPQGRLYAALYNDGTGNSTPGDMKGDVVGIVGILDNGQGSGPQAFYSMSRCTEPNCNLPGEYEILTSGIFEDVEVALNVPYRFSLSWNGSNVTLGCDDSAISYTLPNFPCATCGPPKGRKGIGTRVSEIITNSDEWAYVAATFDNVVITKTDNDLDGIDDAWEAQYCEGDCDPNADPDLDGLTNLREYQLGFNPNIADTRAISASAGANGSIDPSGVIPVNYGSNKTFTITPAVGYHVADVSVDGGSVGAVPSYTFTNVKETHTISASFAIDTFTISGRVSYKETGLAGVTMMGLPGNPETNGSGFYTATVDYGWSGTVTPGKTGYTFIPDSTTYTNVTENQTQNYDALLAATTTKREEETGGLKICSEFKDVSGYPTKMYNCLDPSYSACNCPDGLKSVWELKPFSDIQAGLDHITWVGPGPDPLSVDIITGSSTCVRRCYPSGYCYVGPPGCSGLQIAAVVSAIVLPPPPPVITFRQEKIGDVEICSKPEPGNESGCPTWVYSCSDPLKVRWPTAEFSQITAGTGHITWVGIGSDPVCPTVNIVTESSTCVRRCYPSGYCYVGPPGCK
ncbi:MAG: hypothetical protein A2157_02000 [Deltaproteobacteria bacterium RBG_16_47_11]|nr:MAG: hypothetical protein A2157_02000 [Deltaproteobacteria bacterium RBG_16_47_11]